MDKHGISRLPRQSPAARFEGMMTNPAVMRLLYKATIVAARRHRPERLRRIATLVSDLIQKRAVWPTQPCATQHWTSVDVSRSS